ncbi:MAG: Hsp20/alpha crystallin family protein [Mucilaginibacter sp.]|uniref:Hsp20/alpha crystallin family protein n=1 Tax=Mucilaginibacter sp. L3T2-6 TaxID=3062491 RepID=UPI002674FF06|nr:Hsp20/alpha crystallin family protein [Mucilaginibacter sp. L3T2-6]MDO3643639.1 Hsp20/alpha crystallin family protein [Mucilaginibacter sp. L3T2-6]MDV6216113.1 Hsp20/alpha crystallin family protein [Mucilaginibacter sp. L3T2-6]
MTTLVKSTRFPSLRTMMEDFWNTDRFFEKAFGDGDFLPAVNIRDAKNSYKVDVAAPGFKKDDFKIATENGVLTISAETHKDEKEETENYTRREFSSSSFTRTFTLPENVDEDHISANYNNGLLEIELKKTGKTVAAKKEIKVA